MVVLQTVTFVLTLVTAIILALCGYNAAGIVAIICAASAASLVLTVPLADGTALKKTLVKLARWASH